MYYFLIALYVWIPTPYQFRFPLRLTWGHEKCKQTPCAFSLSLRDISEIGFDRKFLHNRYLQVNHLAWGPSTHGTPHPQTWLQRGKSKQLIHHDSFSVTVFFIMKLLSWNALSTMVCSLSIHLHWFLKNIPYTFWKAPFENVYSYLGDFIYW